MKAGFILIYSFVTAHNLYIGLFFCCSSVPSAWEVLPEATPSWFSLSAHPLPPITPFCTSASQEGGLGVGSIISRMVYFLKSPHHTVDAQSMLT